MESYTLCRILIFNCHNYVLFFSLFLYFFSPYLFPLFLPSFLSSCINFPLFSFLSFFHPSFLSKTKTVFADVFQDPIAHIFYIILLNLFLSLFLCFCRTLLIVGFCESLSDKPEALYMPEYIFNILLGFCGKLAGD